MTVQIYLIKARDDDIRLNLADHHFIHNYLENQLFNYQLACISLSKYFFVIFF